MSQFLECWHLLFLYKLVLRTRQLLAATLHITPQWTPQEFCFLYYSTAGKSNVMVPYVVIRQNVYVTTTLMAGNIDTDFTNQYGHQYVTDSLQTPWKLSFGECWHIKSFPRPTANWHQWWRETEKMVKTGKKQKNIQGYTSSINRCVIALWSGVKHNECFKCSYFFLPVSKTFWFASYCI